VIPIALYFMFTPFIMVSLGVIAEKMNIKNLREIGAIVLSAVNILGVYSLYGMVQDSVNNILIVSLVGPPPLGACLEIDMLSIYMAFSASLLGLFTTIYSMRYMEHDTRLTEFYTLLCTLVVAMIGVAFAGDFFTLFIFWEIMGITSYTLVAFRKESWGPIEAGFKYMVMGAIGSTILLMGIGLVYGMTGTVNFAHISSVLKGAAPNLWIQIVFIIILIGFGIKSAIVPMHTWLPDAHPEAPSPISAMLSGMLIETALYGLSRVLFLLFEPDLFQLPIAILAVVTMSVGNMLALLQPDVKRMLAYSSIAQVGYMLIGLAAGTAYGALGLFLHIFNHSLMKGMAFLSIGSIVHEAGTRNISELKGVGRLMPFTTLATWVAFMGLGGVPGTNGFISKFILFNSAIGAGYYILAIIGVLNSALSMYYYLKVLMTLMAKPDNDTLKAKEVAIPMVGVVIVMAILIIYLGLLPGNLINLASDASDALVTNLSEYIGAVLS
jgi:multicomponent Na+:H+ antiporter subunit D